MRKALLIFFTFFTYIFSYSQAGTGPVQFCSSTIPEICNGALYPAATSGTATAPFGANLNCGFTPMSANASFYYFLSTTNGPLNINVTPTDVIGTPYPNLANSPDLDVKCWGPYNDLLTMCDQLTNANQEYCSTAPATTQEVIQITNAVAGEFYVVMVSNWAATGSTPDPCFIQFTSAGPNDGFGGPSPGDAGGSVGPLLFCDTDPVINLIDELNGVPVNFGSWTFNGNPVSGTFDPASDPIGIYTYTVAGTANCPSDQADVEVDVFSASSISVTSQAVICSDESAFTLTGIPPAGWSAQGQGVFTDNTGTIITDFDPAFYGVGNHNITYTFTPTGCVPIPVGSSILVNEAPTVLSSNITVNNPSCYGFTDGSVNVTASGGTQPYIFEWQDVSGNVVSNNASTGAIFSSGTFNYTVTDNNQCTYSSSVTLYDPLNTSSVMNEYNSSCFGENDGSASLTMLGSTTPPGTVSLLSYCASNPSPSLAPQPQTIIEEVELIGDNFDLNNNTAGLNDFYEDYTNNTGLNGEYADITEGGIYTINITLNDLSATGSYAPEAINAYIDFNIDGDFLDAGEDLGIINIPWGTWIPGTVYPLNFTVPSTGAFGATRMRIVCMSNASGAAINMGPCEASSRMNLPWFGATEDYSVVLNAASSSATFLWDDGSTTDSISNLGPGTYNVIITVAGCPVLDSAVITEPAEIMFNPTITEISCNSFSDGAIILNPSGGNGGAYTIDWGTTNNLALSDGSYIVTVSDPSTITTTNSVACENDTTIIMIEPEYFSVDFTTSSNEICFDDPVTLDLNFNQGGVAPFTVNYTVNALAQVAGPINNTGINNISVSPSVGNNTYSITNITDANGCVNQNNPINAQNIYVNPLPDISITALPNPICVGDDATLLFTPVNGTPPYILDYTESVNTTLFTANVPAAGLPVIVNPDTTTNYSLTYVTDSKNCESSLSENTILVVNEIPQVNFSSQNETCDGDIIQLNFNFTAGAAPWFVNYSVNGVSTSIPFNNMIDSIAISPATASVYQIDSITDDNNCTNNISQTLTITTNPLPEIVLSGGGSICDDGSTADITFTTSSGTPPYNLNYSAGLISNSASNIGNIYTISTNQSGIYTIQDLTDSKGCKAIAISGNAYVNVNPLPEAAITAYPISANLVNSQITFIDLSSGHTSGFWDFDDGSTIQTNFDKLTYNYSDTGTFQASLIIESDSGCTDIASQTIIISPVFTIYIPNAFTPNNDLHNDYFLPITDGVSEFELTIYDRSGKEVFKTNDFSNDYLSCITDNACNAAWDGKIKNGDEYATKGSYVYKINLTDFNGKLRAYSGSFTLIR